MIRFLLIFAFVFVLAMTLLFGVAAQYGINVLEERTVPGASVPVQVAVLGISLIIALYVSWRINTILGRRAREAGDGPRGAQKSKLSAIFDGGESAATRQRRERLDARKRELVRKGKLSPDELPPEPATPAEPAPQPTRVSRSASIEDKMAARAERIRRAKEEGKI